MLLLILLKLIITSYLQVNFLTLSKRITLTIIKFEYYFKDHFFIF